MYNDVVWNKPEHSMEFLSFIDQFHSFNSRQTDRQTDLDFADYFKIIMFWNIYIYINTIVK